MLILGHLRRKGINQHIIFQTDWGEEFGGKSIEKIEELNRIFFIPLNSTLVRIPKGHKEFNGKI